MTDPLCIAIAAVLFATYKLGVFVGRRAERDRIAEPVAYVPSRWQRATWMKERR